MKPSPPMVAPKPPLDSLSSAPLPPETQFTLPPRRVRPTLLNLCLGVLGRHLEDLIDDLDTIAHCLPPPVKMSLLAIARRRGSLVDEVLLALADESWEMLDLSGSEVTDLGIMRVSERCFAVKSVDISRCRNLTASSVKALVQNCPMLQTLRCGGDATSNAAARESLQFILPGLKTEEKVEDSWETLALKQIVRGAQSLRWLVWPSIDDDSRERLVLECPRVVVNPSSRKTPAEALYDIELDSSAVMGIDPSTWSDKVGKNISGGGLSRKLGGLSIAERFKLAFVERDERLAPKRAKNLRQRQRRAEKAWLSSDTNAKAMVLAGFAQRTLRK